MKPTYEELEAEIAFLKVEVAELKLALTGRTMSCVWCNDTAKKRDEAIKERDEAIKERDEAVNELDDVSDVMIALYRKLAAGLESKEKQATPLPPHEFKETTQQYYVKWMNNPIIKDIKFKAVDDDAV